MFVLLRLFLDQQNFFSFSFRFNRFLVLENKQWYSIVLYIHIYIYIYIVYLFLILFSFLFIVVKRNMIDVIQERNDGLEDYEETWTGFNRLRLILFYRFENFSQNVKKILLTSTTLWIFERLHRSLSIKS